MAAEPITAAQPIVVTLDAKHLSKCLAACLKHAARDGTCPALERIHIVPKDGGVLFECTDGFRALRWTVPAPSLHTEGTVSFQLGYDQARAIYATLPKAGPYDLELQPVESAYVDLERSTPTPKLRVELNTRYLREALDACKGAEYVAIDLTSPKEAIVIKGEHENDAALSLDVLIMPAHTNR